MKIAIISDFHLGTKARTPREKDSFDQAREAFERALKLGAQLVLIPGDVFDARIPKQEVWSEAMRILSLASKKENREVTLAHTIGKDEDEITALPLRGIPVVAVHGNHERRGKGFVDSIEALESAGLVIRLHHNSIVLDTPEERIAVHGMGHVPGEYAKDLLDKWSPQPVEGATNIFMIHQGLGRFTFSSEEKPTLNPADVPREFDLYVSGHVHYKAESEVHGKPLIFPGSTIRTQLLPVEAEEPKGFYMVDLKENGVSYDFIELESVRDFFYEKGGFKEATPNQIEGWIKSKSEELMQKPLQNQDKRPLARIRLRGELAKGDSRSEIGVSEIEAELEDKILLSISREGLSSPELEEKAQLLKDIRQEKISIEERGMKILESNLEGLDYDQKFDPKMLFNLLSEDKVNEAFDKVSERLEELTESTLEEKR